MSQNPYAAPASAPAAPASAGGMWRQGTKIVAANGTPFPDVCVKTGVPTSNRLRRKHSWHPPIIIVTFLLSPLIYIIIALIVRKTSQFSIAISPEAVSKRKVGIAIGFAVAAIGIGLFVVGMSYSGPGPNSNLGVLMLVGAVVFILGIVLGSKIGAYYGIKRIDKQFTVFTGVHESLLSTLPEYPGP